VFDLVFWSFVIAVTPLALGLAWKLIVQVGNWIVLGFSRPAVNNDSRRVAHTINRPRISGYGSASGWTPCT
jgi:hypothetical protein